MTIKNTCDTLLTLIGSELDRITDLTIADKDLFKKIKKTGLANIYLKEEWPSERKKILLQAKKTIFAIGYNLTNTFESEWGVFIRTIKNKG